MKHSLVRGMSAVALALAPITAIAVAPAHAAVTTTAISPSQVSSAVDIPNASRGQYNWLGIASQAPGVATRDLYWRDQLQWGGQIERSAGQYDFSTFDAGLAAAKAQGGRFSFRIMTLCPGCGGNLTPSYLPRQASGAPDWNNEAFLSSWERLMKALGARYDADPRLGTVDIGGYGLWGEWEFPSSFGTPITDANAQRMMRAVIDSFPNHYKQMNFMDPYVGMAVAMSPKVGYRFDCIGGNFPLSYEYLSPAMKDVWKHAPVVGEWCPTSDTTATRGLDHVQAIHLSSLSSGNFNTPYTQLSASEQSAYVQSYVKSGFRYSIDRVTMPTSAPAGSAVSFSTQWSNRGVAPTYDTWKPTLRLIDSTGKVAWQAPINLDLKTVLAESGQVTATLNATLPSTLRGTYTVSIAVVDPSGYLAPMNLVSANRDAQGGYTIGTMSVTSSVRKRSTSLSTWY